MNALIIITRTYESEFLLFTNDSAEQTIQINTPDVALLIADGFHFFDESDLSKMQQMIELKMSGRDYGSTILTIHPRFQSPKLETQIKDLFKSPNWGECYVRFYSSSGNENTAPIYKDHLKPLGTLLKNEGVNATVLPKWISNLYNDRLADEVLELKLDLLHRLLSDHNLTNLSPVLDEYFDVCETYLSSLEKGIDQQTALSSLRDQLLIIVFN